MADIIVYCSFICFLNVNKKQTEIVYSVHRGEAYNFTAIWVTFQARYSGMLAALGNVWFDTL